MNIARNMVAVLFLLMIGTESCAEETIRLASGQWAPYQSEELKYAGVVSRIVTEAFALEGVMVEYGYFPWKRSYIYAESGQWDGTFLWFDTPERRKEFYISDPVIDIVYVFFHLKSYQFDWNSMEDLKGMKIGATLGYDYGDSLQDAEKSGAIIVDRVPSDEQNFAKLLAGRFYIAINDMEAGYAIIQKNFTPDKIELFAHHPRPVKAEPHHLLLSKKIDRNKLMIELFNRGLKRLKESGRYDQYIEESRRGEYKQ